MSIRLSKTLELLRFNWKPLLVFEILYRLLGIAIIFPLSNFLLYITVKLTGNEYLINSDLGNYISRPSTIFIAIIVILLFGIYITYEVVVLSILFHSSYYKRKLSLYSLFVSSLIKLKTVFRKYNLAIIISSVIFLFVVEGLHLVGIASTSNVPSKVFNELNSTSLFYPFVISVVLVTFILFFETIFFELQATIESTSIKMNFKHSNAILKNNRFKIFFEFMSVNFVLNLVIYFLYFIVILMVGLLLILFKDDSTVYPLILTFLYTIYLVIGFIATIVLIPINFAWINVWYYEHKKTSDYETQNELKKIVIIKSSFSNKIINRITSLTSISLILLVIFIFSSISDNPSHLELFNTPSVISHRGGGYSAPENTISGIQAGIEYGADAIEVDVRFTKDGVPILMHDSTLGRTTNDTLNRTVESQTLIEIKRFDAGSWFSDEYSGEQIPTLEEAIDILSGNVKMFIELKTSYPGSDEIIVKILEEANAESKVKILSFNSNLLKDIKNRNEDIETMLLLETFVGDINNLSQIDYIDDYGFNYQVVETNNQYVKKLQQSGKGVYVWTANSEMRILELIRLDVDGITTDYPLLTRELVYSDSLKSVFSKLLERIFKSGL